MSLAKNMDFDKEFIEQLVKQDQRAFNEFYLKTVDMFFRYINSNFFVSKEEAEDIISNFYVKRWNVVKKYDFKQSFSAFAWTVFKNLVKDSFKKQKDISFSSFDYQDGESFEENIEDEFDIFELLETDFQFKQIEDAMKQLDIESRELIYLKFIEEKENMEIAEILQISNENVRQKLSRSLKKLKSLLINET
ncbi:MAG: sigma-70 family RNA polymerase sigma factor [Candidatus Absconditabacterales bacterium]|nr:sigma-70 family RNA polymerase sigma factor [Candidatus Absconditabacterales bacterium]